MVRQVYTEYHLPYKPEELTLAQVRWWYEPLMPGMIELAKMRTKHGK